MKGFPIYQGAETLFRQHILYVLYKGKTDVNNKSGLFL